MTKTLLAGIEIAAVVCAVATLVFVVATRCLWRRGKTLREP